MYSGRVGWVVMPEKLRWGKYPQKFWVAYFAHSVVQLVDMSLFMADGQLSDDKGCLD